MQLTVAVGIATVLASVVARKPKYFDSSQLADNVQVEEEDFKLESDFGGPFEAKDFSDEEDAMENDGQIIEYQDDKEEQDQQETPLITEHVGQQGYGSVSISGFSYEGRLAKDPATGEPYWKERKKVIPPTTISYGIPREELEKVADRRSKNIPVLHE